MNEQTVGRVERACLLATGEIPSTAAADDNATNIIGAKKDLNAKGNGPEWYRMVYRNGSWEYVSSERLPPGRFLASDRRAQVCGDVFCGEIVVQHDKGKPIDAAWLVCEPDENGKALLPITFTTKRDGKLAFTLPHGGPVMLPNPRR